MQLLLFCRDQLLLLTVITLASLAHSIPLDNGVEGEPEIECRARSLIVQFSTRQPFGGHVYVKGFFSDPGCRAPKPESKRSTVGVEVPFERCGVARTRSLTPRGITVATSIVISFHPHFMTKVDRAYRFECFYAEAQKQISGQVDVEELSTELVTVPLNMPSCEYRILLGGPAGEPVHVATVGQRVYHEWSCEATGHEKMLCMLVHSCVIDDGRGDKVSVVDADGCPLDRFLLNDLDYPEDLRAGQESHVYKYADRPLLYYQCQITLSVREPDADECPRPMCSGGASSFPASSSPASSPYRSPVVTRADTTIGRVPEFASPGFLMTASNAADSSPPFTPPPDPAFSHDSVAVDGMPSEEDFQQPFTLGNDELFLLPQAATPTAIRSRRTIWKVLPVAASLHSSGNTLDVRAELTAIDEFEEEEEEEERAATRQMHRPPPPRCSPASTLLPLLVFSALLSALFLLLASFYWRRRRATKESTYF